MPNFSDASLRELEVIASRRAGKSAWKKIHAPCDLCAKRAIWEHPYGGRRCGTCPRSESALSESQAK